MINTGKRGISLVALIVTIIVLIILTAAVIVTFMEGGIIDKAKEAVFKSDIRTYQEILAVKNAENMINLATGNGEGKEINADVLEEIQAIIPEFKEEYEGLIEISNGQIVLGSKNDERYGKWLTDLGILSSNIIPEGGVYYKGVERNDEDGSFTTGEYNNATVYNAGDEFPELQNGDVYVYGDYEYRYNMVNEYIDWQPANNIDGWTVVRLDYTKSSYGEILTTINGKNVTNMDYAFADCSSLIEAPVIPNTITSMICTFQSCYSLKKVFEIPDSVIDMNGTFHECESLESISYISKNVENLDDTFWGNLSLKSVPKIYNKVKYMNGTFAHCFELQGIIEIDANPTSYVDAFMDTEKEIILTGASAILNEIAGTADNGNVTVATE